MTNKKTDERVIRTRERIRAAYLTLVPDHRPGDIKITDIASVAQISRRTFYLQYDDPDEVAEDICHELAQELISHFTDDTVHDVETLYRFLDGADEPVKRLLLSDDYRVFQRQFYHETFHAGAFGTLCASHANQEIAEGYLTCVIHIWKQYTASPTHGEDIHALSVSVAGLIEHGITSLMQADT